MWKLLIFHFNFALLILNFSLSVGCKKSSSAQNLPPEKVIATVNKIPIALNAFERILSSEGWKYGIDIADEKNFKTIKMQILESLIKDTLLLQQAEKEGISLAKQEIQDDLTSFQSLYQQKNGLEKALEKQGLSLEVWQEERKNQLLIKKLAQSFGNKVGHVSKSEIKTYYQQNRSRFVQPEKIHLKQITTDSWEKSENLRKRILKGDSFEEMAKKYSLSPDREKGGDIGFFSRGTMPAEFDTVGFTLEKGELSPVIQSTYGYHIFKLVDRIPPKNIPLEQVEKDIRSQIQTSLGKKAFDTWYQEKRKNAEIYINQAALDEFQPEAQEGIADNEE